METVFVHPANLEQLNAVKAILSDLKIQFEVQEDNMSPALLATINKGLDEYHKNGKGISFDEFKEKHFLKR